MRLAPNVGSAALAVVTFVLPLLLPADAAALVAEAERDGIRPAP